MPKAVLNQALKTLGRREQDWREFLRQLEAERGRLMEESDELAKGLAALEKDRRIMADREARFKHQQESFKEESEQKLARVLDFADHESKRLVKELKTQQKASMNERAEPDRLGTEAKERIRAIETIARQELAPVLPKPRVRQPGEIAVGAHAKHRGLGIEGRVASLKGKTAILETSPGRRAEVSIDELEPVSQKQPTETRLAGGRVRVKAEFREIDSELNLIGRASDDVEFEIHRFVESALASGYRFIRLVHGHGTGRLKKAVRDILRDHPNIASIEDAPQAQGGAGATVVVLR
jgi:DNA mismatch repair protein MutS2